MSPEYRFQMQETCLHDEWLDLLFLLEVSNLLRKSIYPCKRSSKE
jgi:hypothetical protein